MSETFQDTQMNKQSCAFSIFTSKSTVNIISFMMNPHKCTPTLFLSCSLKNLTKHQDGFCLFSDSICI